MEIQNRGELPIVPAIPPPTSVPFSKTEDMLLRIKAAMMGAFRDETEKMNAATTAANESSSRGTAATIRRAQLGDVVARQNAVKGKIAELQNGLKALQDSLASLGDALPILCSSRPTSNMTECAQSSACCDLEAAPDARNKIALAATCGQYAEIETKQKEVKPKEVTLSEFIQSNANAKLTAPSSQDKFNVWLRMFRLWREVIFSQDKQLNCFVKQCLDNKLSIDDILVFIDWAVNGYFIAGINESCRPEIVATARLLYTDRVKPVLAEATASLDQVECIRHIPSQVTDILITYIGSCAKKALKGLPFYDQKPHPLVTLVDRYIIAHGDETFADGLARCGTQGLISLFFKWTSQEKQEETPLHLFEAFVREAFAQEQAERERVLEEEMALATNEVQLWVENEQRHAQVKRTKKPEVKGTTQTNENRRSIEEDVDETHKGRTEVRQTAHHDPHFLLRPGVITTARVNPSKKNKRLEIYVPDLKKTQVNLHPRVRRWSSISNLSAIKQFPDLSITGKARYASMVDVALKGQLKRHFFPKLLQACLVHDYFISHYCFIQGESCIVQAKLNDEAWSLLTVGKESHSQMIYHMHLLRPQEVTILQLAHLTLFQNKQPQPVEEPTAPIQQEAHEEMQQIVDPNYLFPLLVFRYRLPVTRESIILTIAPTKSVYRT